MSTDPLGTGGKGALEAAAAESARLIEEATAQALAEEQDDLFDPVTAEEAAEAYEALGNDPGPLTVLRHVREARKVGRPKGVKNRRSRDVIEYLSQFGPDPAVVMMKILGESEEAMIARSKQVDPSKKQLSWAEARALRLRAAEGVRKIFHGDKPVQADVTITGIRMIQQIGEVREAQQATVLEGRIKGTLPVESGERAE